MLLHPLDIPSNLPAGLLPLTLNSGSTAAGANRYPGATYVQGRLVPSADGSALALAGYNGWSTSGAPNVSTPIDVAVNGREPVVFSLLSSGIYNISFPCQSGATSGSRPTLSPYFCDLFDLVSTNR